MQEKRVRRKQERMLAGVAGGIASSLNVDPVLVRLAFVLLSLLNGIGIILYLIMWILMPVEDTEVTDSRGQLRENISDMQKTVRQFVSWVERMLKA